MTAMRFTASVSPTRHKLIHRRWRPDFLSSGAPKLNPVAATDVSCPENDPACSSKRSLQCAPVDVRVIPQAGLAREDDAIQAAPPGVGLVAIEGRWRGIAAEV